MHTVNLLCSCLPAGFFHAWNLAFIGKFSEADSGDAEFAEIGVRPAADFTPVIRASRELWRRLLFVD
jgi:hypothetical protein